MKYISANVEIVLKSGVERKFRIHFTKPLANDSEEVANFVSLVSGSNRNGKLDVSKIPFADNKMVILKHDNIEYVEMEFIEYEE